MELVLFCILLLVCALAMIEERLRKYNLAVYITLGIVLILFAGLREIGFDKDSENYEIYFYHYDDPGMELTVEYSFRLLSRIFYSLFGDVRSIFLFYALVGVSLKMFALRRLSEFWFLPICVYISYFYIVHDLTQIRASVVSGLTLLAIPYICERKRKTALAILFAGCLFHYSAIALLPILFLSSADMNMKHRVAWACLLPLGFLLHFLPFDIFTAIEIPYITDKIVTYEDLRDKGIIGEEVNVFNLVFLVKCAIYIYILYFYDIIKPNFKYLSLAVKMMGISLFVFPALSKLPVMSFRVSDLYGIAEIPAIACLCYTIHPKWVGKLLVTSIAIILFVIYVFVQEVLNTT